MVPAYGDYEQVAQRMIAEHGPIKGGRYAKNYLRLVLNLPKEKPRKMPTPVLLIRGDETLEFPSQAAAARSLGVNASAMSYAVRFRGEIDGWRIESPRNGAGL